MPRSARFVVENGIYHIMLRGNNKAVIFHENKDYLKYISLLIESKKRFLLKIFHYILMSNHLHLIVQALTGEKLAAAIKRINISYVLYYRKKYGGIGHFFQDRFKSFLIQEGRYLLECGRYIELNPVRAGIVKKPEEYPWSSYRFYTEGASDSLVDMSPEYEALSDDAAQRKIIYKEYVETERKERRSKERFFKTGIYGSHEFIAQMKNQGLKSAWSHSGQPKKRKNVREVNND